MIRLSAIFVAGAILVLVAGVLAASLLLVYVSIGVSLLASVLLAAGVIVRRREIFGDAGAVSDSQPPTWSAGPADGAAAMAGGRASIRPVSERPAEAGSANGNSGAQADWEAGAEAGGDGPDRAGYPMIGPARAPRGNGPGRNGQGEEGPARTGPARPRPEPCVPEYPTARPGRAGPVLAGPSSPWPFRPGPFPRGAFAGPIIG